jgi:hypothetical protein
MSKVIVSLAILLVLGFVLYQGWIISPRFLVAYLKRKKVYPLDPLGAKSIEGAGFPSADWKVKYPNATLYVIVNGGIGNVLLSYALAIEACRVKGLRLPVLLGESWGQFDYHRIPSAKYGLEIGSVTELMPTANFVTMHSQYSCFTTLEDKTLWKADSIDNLHLRKSMIQTTVFRDIMPVSDEAYDFVRRSINPEIVEYVKRHYNMESSSVMGIHLRMGQPTDDFIPPCPSYQDIINHFQAHPSTNRIMVFTDNQELAKEVLEKCNLPGVEWVGESAPVEFIMLGMCSSAIISHSTFSYVACRLFNLKSVSMAVSSVSSEWANAVDQAWNIILKDLAPRRSQKV